LSTGIAKNAVEQWFACLPFASILSSSPSCPKEMTSVADLSDNPALLNALIDEFSYNLKQTIHIKCIELKLTLEAIAKRDMDNSNAKYIDFDFKNALEFFKNLYDEDVIGRPDPNWFHGMLAEHGVEYDFTTGNYKLKTTVKEEWDQVVNGKSAPAEAMGHGRCIRPLDDLMALPIVTKAKLRREEVIALVLYTGPMFMLYNSLLRKGPWDKTYKDLQERGISFPTTTLVLMSALQKVSRVSGVAEDLMVFRGLAGDMKLADSFLKPDALGRVGGMESAFMSTTSNLDMAIQYSGADQGKAYPKVLRIRVGAVDRPADISSLSQYPEEKESLFGPRCYLEPYGEPETVLVNGHLVEFINVRVNCNMKIMTVEQYEAQKRELHLAAFAVIVRDLRVQLKQVSDTTE